MDVAGKQTKKAPGVTPGRFTLPANNAQDRRTGNAITPRSIFRELIHISQYFYKFENSFPPPTMSLVQKMHDLMCLRIETYKPFAPVDILVVLFAQIQMVDITCGAEPAPRYRIELLLRLHRLAETEPLRGTTELRLLGLRPVRMLHLAYSRLAIHVTPKSCRCRLSSVSCQSGQEPSPQLPPPLSGR